MSRNFGTKTMTVEMDKGDRKAAVVVINDDRNNRWLPENQGESGGGRTHCDAILKRRKGSKRTSGPGRVPRGEITGHRSSCHALGRGLRSAALRAVTVEFPGDLAKVTSQSRD
jgi:hypothetical protein